MADFGLRLCSSLAGCPDRLRSSILTFALQSSQCTGNCSRDTSCNPTELDRVDECSHVCDRLCNEDGDEDVDQTSRRKVCAVVVGFNKSFASR